MSEAFICDAVRTPIGRYGGSLAEVRPDDLGAVPMRALKERNPQVDWEALDDIYYGCANQAGEGQPQRRAHVGAACRTGRERAGDDRQPALRLGPGRGDHGGARHPRGRGRTDDRGRGRKHDARALRHAQGGVGLLARQCGA